MAELTNEELISNMHTEVERALATTNTDNDDIVETLQKNIALNALRSAVNGGWSYANMVEGVSDQFADETGIDTGASSNQLFDGVADTYENAAATPANLLIQSDTTDGSTTFVDSTGTHTLGVNGDIQHDTDQSQFGASSILLDGTGDYLSLSDSTDWDFDTQDFTIDFWMRPAQTLNKYVFIQGNSFGDLSWAFRIGTEVAFLYQEEGGSATSLVTTSSGLAVNTWSHVAVVRNGTDLSIYVDGTQRANTTLSGGFEIRNFAGELRIGRYTPSDDSFSYSGHLDEIRIAKGTAVWTSNFTPPTSAYNTATQDITLQSIQFTAGASATKARAVVLLEPVDSITLNTDMFIDFSADDGTTWTTATLTKDADYDASVEVLTTQDLELTTSGTQMRYRVRSANAKNLKIHGVWYQWR